MTLLFFTIFIITLLGIVLVLSLLRGVSSFLFGGKQQASAYSSKGYSASTNKQSYRQTDTSPHKKVFAKDEGEYVSYEEID